MTMELDQFERLSNELSIDKPLNLVSAAISFAIGYIQYSYAIRLTLREGKGPFAFWQQCFWLAHDSTWAYLCGKAAPQYDNSMFLRGTSAALCIWVSLEIWGIYNAITVEKEEVFGKMFGKQPGGPTLSQMLPYTALLVAVMYVVVLMFIEFVGYDGIFQWFAFTNVVAVAGPTSLWMERGSREGLALGHALTNVVCAVFTFAPFGMWVLMLPEIFDNKVYYASGVAVFLYSLYMVWVIARYPAKTTSKSGEKPIW